MQRRRDPKPTRLRLGIWLLRPAHTWGLLGALLGLPMIVLALLVYVIESQSEEDGDALGRLAALLTELAQDPGNRAMLWIAAVLIPIGAVLCLVQRRAYLDVDSIGLEAHIPRSLGLGLFGQTYGQWRFRWENVRQVKLVGTFRARSAVKRLGGYRLVIETERGEVRLSPFLWFDPAGEDHRLGLDEMVPFRELDAVGRSLGAPLPRAVAARGFEIEVVEEADAEPRSSGFDLTRHKGMVTQLGLFFSAGLYALGDTFFVQVYKPLGPLPSSAFALAGIAGAIAVSKLGRGAPRTERVAVGALTVAACIAAAYPATLRLNASTAEARTAVYVSAGDGRFNAADDRLPPIDLSGEDVAEYWAQYPPGTEHEFTVLRGAAGFYQLELAPFHERTRRFYGSDGNGR